MKTAVIFWSQEWLRLFVVSGDWTRFSDLYINSTEADLALEKELCGLLWDDEGNELIKPCSQDEFIEAIRQGSKVITCGFIL